MSDYILSAESNMDLSKEYADFLDVVVLKSNYELDGEVYLDDFGESLDMKEFYKSMEEGAQPTTSRINTQEYLDHLRKYLDDGKDIIHVCLSTGLSGQFDSLVDAVETLKEEYPDRNIYPVDSRMGSYGIGLLVAKMSKLKKEGMPIDELYDWAIENRLHVINYTSNKNLEYVARGGRISKTAANIGGLLQICPVIEVNDEGELKVISKIRTENKLIDYMVKNMKENAIGSTDYNDQAFIGTCNNRKLASQIKEAIEEEFKNIDGGVQIFDIGPTIGSHIGPGAVGLFYWGHDRMQSKK